MRFLLLVVGIAAFSTSNLGCSLCCTPYNHDYATYGSKYPRADMANGRMGSPFSDPGIKTVGYSIDNTMDEPELLEFGGSSTHPMEIIVE